MKKLIAALWAVILLSGCTTDYGKEDIEKYVREELGLKRFTVSETCEEVTDNADGYKDYLWTVTEKDGTVFRVLDDYHWGMEALTNSLRNDYSDVHTRLLYEAHAHGSLKLEEGTRDSLYTAQLIGTFTDREQLHGLVDDINAFLPYNDGIPLSFQLCFDHPSRYIGDYVQDDGDTSGVLRDKPITYTDAEANFLHQVIDMRYPQMHDFTSEEISAFVYQNNYGVAVGNGSGYEVYDDILTSRFSYGASFRTIYEILIRNGYPVTGTAEEYTFTGTDGNTYRFSDSYRNEETYYYYLNDTETPMEYYFYNHIRLYRIAEITGLDLKEYWETQKKQ